LLVSESYMTQRQALKLLSQILLDRHNFRSMMRYIGDKNNLRIVMNLLRVNDKGIQHETFDVFKVCLIYILFVIRLHSLVGQLVGMPLSNQMQWQSAGS
jgi:hypothetical protein